VSPRRTPYDDVYPTCERTYAELRIYGDILDPDDISCQLKLEPTSVQRKGEVREGFRGRAKTTKVGGWFLSSEGRVDSLDLRRHLDWLLTQLSPAAEDVKVIAARPEVSMHVTCIWWSKYGHGGPTLWPEQMSELARLDLECAFELSFHGADPLSD
jgi:Domain of unknown function (DUF4279)